MSEEYKTIVIACKGCAREFELRLLMHIYENAVAAAEGEPVEFTGTRPDCRRDDPFLRTLDEVPGISSATSLFGKKSDK